MDNAKSPRSEIISMAKKQVVSLADTLKRLSLGITLIAVASGGLLIWDAPQLRGSRDKKRVALLQHSSTTVLDAAVDGMVAGLAERGWVDGDTIKLEKFNPQGDIS